MELSKAIASTAIVLAVLTVAGYVFGEGSVPGSAAAQTGQEKVSEREAQRRAAVQEQQKRKDAFERACNKPLKSDTDFDLCRSAYRALEAGKL